jgi:hypothetical protein
MTDGNGSPLRLVPVPEEANAAFRPEKWLPVPGFSAYEVSDNSVWQADDDGRLTQVSGGYRSLDRVSGTRQLKGQPIRARILANSGGYAAVNLTDDTGTRRTMLVHRLILLAHDKPCPPGMETLHNPERGPLWNRYPEDIRWGTKPENAADKPEPPVPPEPTFECVNHARCGNLVVNQGRRCLDCVAEVGREAADLLRAGTPLQEVAEHFGYTGGDWVYSLAVKHGAYEGSKAQARMQRPDHRPCTCAGCLAPPRQARGVLGRLAVTLRITRRRPESGDTQ